MTERQFIALEKQLLSELPGFAINASLMVMPPVRQFLRGISFEGSSFSKNTFFVNVFVMPLFVPKSYLSFTFGDRVGSSWESDSPNLTRDLAAALREKALPFLSKVNSLADFVEMANTLSADNPHIPNAIAFALIMMGEFQQAIKTFEILLRQVDRQVRWQTDLAEGALALKAMLTSNPLAAQEQLRAWEGETVRNLGLEKFRD